MGREDFCRAVRVVVAVGLLTGLAACSSSTAPGASNVPGISPNSVKVGLLIDETGAYASVLDGVEAAVKARIDLANSQGGVHGRKIQLVIADGASTPTGNLTAARQLVEEENVFGIIEVSGGEIGSYQYLAQAGIPVTSSGFDDQYYGDAKYRNLFIAEGSPAPNFPAATTEGEIFKDAGVTKLAVVGYSDPRSGKSALAAARSAKEFGIPTVYSNLTVPVDTTDFTGIGLAIKQSGANAVFAPIITSANVSLMAALSNLGVRAKMYMAVTGYGRDFLQSSEAIRVAEEEQFTVMNLFAPIELKTPGANEMKGALSKYGGIEGAPNYGESSGYMAADMFIRGLEAAGNVPTRKSFVDGLRAVHNYDSSGLVKSYNVGKFANTANGMGPDNCVYIVQVKGSQWVPVRRWSPICGKIIPGSAQPG
jgi:ABC-type branched-subunit amino acid transport system substrate-binding protein